jgi:hypothetical protein
MWHEGHIYKDIIFQRPVPDQIRHLGLLPADLHFHTNHSDSPTRVKDALKVAGQQGIGLAITDHNQISGVLEAHRSGSGIPLIPGIEVSANDGPHILLYFYSIQDLMEYYERYVERNKRNGPFVAIRLSTEEILEAREGYPCVAAEAHPCGYFFLNRGVQKCIENACVPGHILTRLDALEVICGGMNRIHNLRAAELARRNNLGRTGGTDGHLLHELGSTVTCADADTVDEFLDAIVRRETVVIGREKTLFGKAVMGTAILPHHLPYAVPILQARLEQNMPRIRKVRKPRMIRDSEDREE